jgi:hypothetical protein
LTDDYFTCPCCGAELPSSVHFCRHCGASDDSGWGDERDDPAHDGDFDLDDEFDYDGFLRREFPEHAPRSAPGARKILLGAIVLLLCLLLLLVSLWPS